jgi:UDP-3-O-[3-hydroxymyristoyl] glucosamine N-acyltransferase
MTNSASYTLIYPSTCEEECNTCYNADQDPNYCDPCYQETGVNRYLSLRNINRPTHFCEDVTMSKTLTVAGISTFMSNVFAQMNLEVIMNVLIRENLKVGGNAEIKKDVTIEGNTTIKQNVTIEGNTETKKKTTTKDLTVHSESVVVGGKTFIVKRLGELSDNEFVLAAR